MSPKTVEQLQADVVLLENEADRIADAALQQNRTLTLAENNRLAEILGEDRTGFGHCEVGRLQMEIETRMAAVRQRHEALNNSTPPAIPDEVKDMVTNGQTMQRNKGRHLTLADGSKTRVYGRGERMADEYKNHELVRACAAEGWTAFEFIGAYLQASACGSRDHIPEAIRNQQTIDPDTAGGFTVPSPLSPELIDLLNANLVMALAGSITVPMMAKTLDFGRVVSQPSGGTYAELATITAEDFVFDRATLDAKKFATLTRASRELIADSLYLATEIPRQLTRMLATKIDGQLLNGDGVGENVLGLLNDTNVGETLAAGLVSWDLLSTAVEALLAVNVNMPSAIILSPANWGVLDREKANTAGTWLGASPGVEPIPILVTSAAPDDEIVVGDFSDYYIGQRQNLMIEITIVGDEFPVHGWSCKLTSRTDGLAMRPGSFHVLRGVTQA